MAVLEVIIEEVEGSRSSCKLSSVKLKRRLFPEADESFLLDSSLLLVIL